MAAEGKRCHYEVLGVSRDSTPDEIRSAYKKLALQRHPDKLVQSGLSQAEATAQFQELVQAYEILSDPKERAWYDSHRSQILFSNLSSSNSVVPNSVIPNLFSFFSNTVYSGYTDSGRGFYKVYSDVFDKIYANEINYCRKLGLGLDKVGQAPLMGNLESPYSQTTAFYGYWLAFSTVMDFTWVDEYDAMMGPNRKSRRVMEEENKKLRRKAKREYNETVRGLAEFVKKRDKRVRDEMMRRGEEREKKKEEERQRRKEKEREKMERVKEYEEPEWARVEEEVEQGWEEEEEKGKDGKEEFYCVVCGKKFKSEKQWKNHEQSKKHKEKVAELRATLGDEDEDDDGDGDGDGDEEAEEEENDGADEIEEKFRGGFKILEEESEVEIQEPSDKEEENGVMGLDGDEDEDGDAEKSVLEGMMSGHSRSRKNRQSGPIKEELSPEFHVDDESEEGGPMEYNNRKTRRRRAKKERGKSNGGGAVKSAIDENKNSNEETNGHDDEQMEESASHSFVENKNVGSSDNHLEKNHKSSNQSVDKKGTTKKETKSNPKNSSKGKRGKAKHSDNSCETCGEEFESRNKLHKHLGETGHASLKFR